MTFQDFLAELKVSMRQYFENGLIDDITVERLVRQAVRRFGENVTVLQEAVIDIENGRGQLPESFFSLYMAIKCDRDRIEVSEEDKPILVNSFFWTNVQLKGREWNLCTGEESKNEVEEFTIKEETYINGCKVNKCYKNPQRLRLTKSVKKTLCDRDCYKEFREGSPYEINIIGNTIYTNFDEGEIYLQYKGFDEDEEGFIIIPDTPRGELFNYVNYYVKRNLLEEIMMNGEDVNVANMLKYFMQMEQQAVALAFADVGFMNLTPRSLYKLKGRGVHTLKRYDVFKQ